jgi:hypothetical protein
MKFNASLDTLAKVITFCTTLLFIALITFLVYTRYPRHLTEAAIVGIVPVLIYVGCYIFHPSGYNLEESRLSILRLVKNVSFNLSDIRTVRRFATKEMAGTTRRFGVGGLFGYFGRFYNTREGRLTFYSTRRDTALLLETHAGKKIIISPDDPEELIRMLKSAGVKLAHK